MQIDDRPIALEVKYSNTKEQWYGIEIKNFNIIRQLRMIQVVLIAVPANNNHFEVVKNINNLRAKKRKTLADIETYARYL